MTYSTDFRKKVLLVTKLCLVTSIRRTGRLPLGRNPKTSHVGMGKR
ncbi:hypothetical protein [Beggiatoa leptomitoformis]|uniref:Uncharacterized protein n=1 Tax=Beggiatoa leptomitoformis TaxID=288004 RepID=A0A650GDU4_9GAMM|nr:hypothetical protein [Beggiatoa leptomitoformis]QGX03543.1 hypothetical protein AL038_18525 [Beggiatoa leptomitoformis]QGX04048.1 hypothetical protein BLE401_18480 [Beggiatoa leptomitoformis]